VTPEVSSKRRRIPAVRRAAMAASYLAKAGMKPSAISFDSNDGFTIDLTGETSAPEAASDWDYLLNGTA